ncbi:spore germination protein [Paenibacillus massiliensis]|uniref:spore germination protein n=1 Tax=Paenibacillus massiliensis TaxID=225917 RepID=UPI00046E905D|nr:spore germination protein [Paenibacillus massiliensis]
MWSEVMKYIPGWLIWWQAFLLVMIPIGLAKLTNWLQTAVKNGSFSDSKKSNKQRANKQQSSTQNQHAKQQQQEQSLQGKDTFRSKDSPLTGVYTADMATIRQGFGKNSDVHIREFYMKGTDLKAAVLYVDGLVDQQLMDEFLITTLMREGVPDTVGMKWKRLPRQEAFKDFLSMRLLPVSDIQESSHIQEIANAVLTGKGALLIDGMTVAILIGSAKGKTRSLEEPLSEALLRGPRIGFTERLDENTALLRQIGKNESLFIQQFEVGSRIKKKLAIAYMKDIVNPDLVQQVETRIQRMDMDAMLESGYVEQLIEDSTLSPFQQVLNTERPDRAIGGLLEGRVVIMLDGTPFVLIVPGTFSMLLQSPEDYYDRWIPGTFLRVLRFMSATLALLAPALYISFISFHPGLIPTKLALTIIDARSGVPFPSIIEALIMELAIEILREAGIRLPKPIGPAMGIVGGLIIGQAAVQAGIISQFLVIVVAITAISSFTIPVYSAGITLRILRFVAMFSAAMLGLFGVVMFFLLICTHLARLSSFGVPYVSPAVPYNLRDWKDFVIRAPLSMMKLRPEMTKPNDPERKN